MGKVSSKLPPEDLLAELARETNLSESEIEISYEEFLADYPDGNMGVNHVKQLYEKFFPGGNADKFAEFIFRAYDTNNDGLIDFREFITALSITKRGSLKQRLTWVFSMYDIDKNGKVTKDEMLEVMTAIYRMRRSTNDLPEDEKTAEQSVDKIFELMDTNRDGVLSLHEFIAGVEKNPPLEALLRSPQGYLAEETHTGVQKKK